MAFRQKLVSDIRTHFKQCKWEEMLHDQIVELLEIRPASPYDYIQKKISLRNKLQNNRHCSFLTQLLIYCLHVDPLTTSQSQIQNKILYLCVEKHQHVKFRKNDTINIITSLLLLSSTGEKEPPKQKQSQKQKQSEYFIKITSQQLEMQTVNICQLGHILYSTILYLSMKKEIQTLDEKLAQADLHINGQILAEYLQNVDQSASMLKKMGITSASQADGDLYRIIAMAVLHFQKD